MPGRKEGYLSVDRFAFARHLPDVAFQPGIERGLRRKIKLVGHPCEFSSQVRPFVRQDGEGLRPHGRAVD